MYAKLKGLLRKSPSGFLSTIYSVLTLSFDLEPICYPMAVLSFVLAVTQTVYFINKSDFNFFVKYSSGYLTNLYILLANIVGIYGLQSGSRIVEIFGKWDTIKKATPINSQMQEVLHKIGRKANVSFAIIIVLTVVTTVTDSLYVVYDCWTLLILERTHYIYQESPHYKLIVVLVLVWSVFLMILTFAPCAYFIFALFQLKVALVLLTDYIYDFEKRCKSVRICTSDIMESLQVIIKRQLEIKMYNDQILNANQLLYYLYTCNGMIIPVMSMIAFFSPVHRVYLAAINFTTFLGFLHFLSEVSEEYIQLNDLANTAIYNLDWFNWSLKCQKSYLVIVTYLNKPVVVRFLFFDSNRELFKKMVKGLYPVFNLFYSMKNDSPKTDN